MSRKGGSSHRRRNGAIGGSSKGLVRESILQVISRESYCGKPKGLLIEAEVKMGLCRPVRSLLEEKVYANLFMK